MSKSIAEMLVEYNALAEAAGKPTLKAWKDKKEKLSARINDMYDTMAEKMVKSDTKTAAEWARALKKNPKVVRAKLRKHGFGKNLKAIETGSAAYQIICGIKSN